MVAPGGMLAVTTWGPELFEPANREFWEAVRAENPKLCQEITPWDEIITPHRLCELLTRSGVSGAHAEAVSVYHRLASPADFWQIACGSGYRVTVDALPGEARSRVRDRVLDRLRTNRITAVRTDVIYGLGVRPSLSRYSGQFCERKPPMSSTVIDPQTQGSVYHAVELILAENKHVLEQINAAVLERFISLLANVDRIFVVGEGRSGLAARMFAMRLMHLGYSVYVVGETTTPALRRDDLLIACSGSGTTSAVLTMTTTARLAGGRIVAVTTAPRSSLGEVADLVITIPAAAKRDHSQQYSEQFAGSLFEQAALLLFDAMTYALMHRLDKNVETVWSMHANLE